MEDALVSVDYGCDALGFVFYKKSPRYIEPDKARDIIERLPKNIIKIGVFVDAEEEIIKCIAKLCKLDMLQFHGKESPEFCKKFKGYKIIKAFRVRNKINLSKILIYKTFAYLFDTFVQSMPGGTGKTFNWKFLDNIGRINCPVFLSGGLNAENVKEAIKIVNPAWVDASSSLEIRPGKKDYNKVKEFVTVVKPHLISQDKRNIR